MIKVVEEADAGDVLVVGGGVTGVLTALELQARGLRVTVVDRAGLGAEQSGHSHGYLHRGYIYRAGEEALVSHLGDGASRWGGLLEDLGCNPVAESAFVCFANELTARAAASAWTSVGLPVERTDAPVPGLRSSQLDAVFRTAEATFDFVEFFRAVSSGNRLGQTLLGNVKRLERRGDRVTGAVVEIAGALTRMRARSVILAAGTDNARLAETAVRYRGRASVRASLMVVIANPQLPPLSTVMPGNETHGLFLVSRRRDDHTVWLASNFVSFAEQRPSSTLSDLWLGGIVEKLATFCTGVRTAETLWGVYEAPKAELRAAPGVVGAHALERYGLSNLLVLAPTKLTLAPLLARDAAIAILSDGLAPAASREGPRPLGPELPVCPERWSQTPLYPRDQFFGTDGRRAAGSLLARQPHAVSF